MRLAQMSRLADLFYYYLLGHVVRFACFCFVWKYFLSLLSRLGENKIWGAGREGEKPRAERSFPRLVKYFVRIIERTQFMPLIKVMITPRKWVGPFLAGLIPWCIKLSHTAWCFREGAERVSIEIPIALLRGALTPCWTWLSTVDLLAGGEGIIFFQSRCVHEADLYPALLPL